MDFFVSYAQNFEDVMLWRALKHIKNGFYVDVGANDPKFDSVTQAFYERGWRGINIEPVPSYFESLCQERPKDINLPFAVAESDREITLFEVPGTGLSSVIKGYVESTSSGQRSVVEHSVKALTLNSILDKYSQEHIHFLKIDVEGFEKEVLGGLDLSKWRPWIIVIEATIANSSEVVYETWEPNLLSSVYTFVYFDGLNRFYVAKEHAELVGSFDIPPNYFDNFIKYQQAESLRKIANQDSVIQSLSEKLKKTDTFLVEIDGLRTETRNERDRLRSELETVRTEIRNERDWLRSELETVRTEIRKERDWLISELETARTDLSQLRAEKTRTENERDRFRSEVETARTDLSQFSKEKTRAEDERDRYRSELDCINAEVKNIRAEYINILYSRSYRITAPLRALYLFLSKLSKNSPERVQEQNSDPEIKKVDTFQELIIDKTYFQNLFELEIDKVHKLK